MYNLHSYIVPYKNTIFKIVFPYCTAIFVPGVHTPV
jgi:hypothetical protein